MSASMYAWENYSGLYVHVCSVGSHAEQAAQVKLPNWGRPEAIYTPSR